MADGSVENAGLLAETGDGLTQLVPEVLQGGAADVGEFDIVEVVPDALVEGIEVWGIAWQRFEPEPSGSTVGEEVLDRLAAVDGCTVPDDSSVPGTWASRCFKKRATSTLLRAWSCTCCSSRPSAVTPPMVARWSRVAGTCSSGVCARGA
jgi:hypothetical protein